MAADAAEPARDRLKPPDTKSRVPPIERHQLDRRTTSLVTLLRKYGSRCGFNCDAVPLSLQGLDSSTSGVGGASLVEFVRNGLTIGRLTTEQVIEGDCEAV